MHWKILQYNNFQDFLDSLHITFTECVSNPWTWLGWHLFKSLVLSLVFILKLIWVTFPRFLIYNGNLDSSLNSYRIPRKHIKAHLTFKTRDVGCFDYRSKCQNCCFQENSQQILWAKKICCTKNKTSSKSILSYNSFILSEKYFKW